jgi:transcription elongation factor/antiterminator RfaH
VDKLSWYAIYTKPKCEDIVALQLRSIGINVLTPKIKTKRYRYGRTKEVIETLFPCYIFAEFDVLRHNRTVKYIKGVRYIVGKDAPIKVSNEIINSITNHTEDGLVKIEPKKLEKGQVVRIKEGPFKGFNAIFEKQLKGAERISLLLEEINARLDIDACFVEKI